MSTVTASRRLCLTIRMASVVAIALVLVTMAPAQQPSSPRVIDGSLNPELIPDSRVYSILLRFVANRSNRELAAIQAYLVSLGLGNEGCSTCGGGSQSTPNMAKINALIAIGQDYSARANELEVSFRERLSRNPDLDAKAEAAKLRRDKDLLCSEFVAALGAKLGPVDAERVRLHVQRMKRNIKLIE